jgi:hypothetical protein
VTLGENFPGLLQARGRSREVPETEDVYGWLVGSWELDVVHYKGVDVSSQKIKGEAHFSWVLEGRAIQDVWIMPRASDRKPESERIRWMNPVSGHEERQTGRRVGEEIVQIGARADGTPTRWRFTEITANSFHWIGEALRPDGKTWVLEGEFQARRIRQ